MSGINGFNWSNKILIRQMNESVRHRGMDSEGTFIDENISLGHTRLSIIDLSKNAKQPMSNEDESIWITYDGKIYNFQILREKLESRGHVFKSKTDTEVILHSYEENGTNSFKKFNGMFAFCIYDNNLKNAYLVRDRLGIKPLYYYDDGDKFVFSSEIKTFKKINDILFSLEKNAILEYFLTRSVTPESFFGNIKALEPGHYLKIDLVNRAMSKASYFNIFELLSKEKYIKNKNSTEKKLIDCLDHLLNNVVKDQLTSDRSVGTICSGGVDSSLLTAIAKKYCSNLKVFNVRVNDELLDESKYAEKVAKHLGVKLIEDELNQNKFKNLYKKCISIMDLPLIHPSSVGLNLIGKKAKEEGIDVLLGGEGADELFGGYHQYKYLYRRLLFTKTPLLSYINKKGRVLIYFKDFTNYMLEDANYIINQYKNLPWNNNRYNANRIFYEALGFLNKDLERKISAYILKDLKYYLPPTLWEADRMFMGAGVELRMPFLDNRLVDFAVNLPLKFKVGFFKTKYLLKKVAERYLPKDIVYRRKMGFGIPTEKWLGDKDLDFKKIMYADWEKIYNIDK